MLIFQTQYPQVGFESVDISVEMWVPSGDILVDMLITQGYQQMDHTVFRRFVNTNRNSVPSIFFW